MTITSLLQGSEPQSQQADHLCGVQAHGGLSRSSKQLCKVSVLPAGRAASQKTSPEVQLSWLTFPVKAEKGCDWVL